MMGIFSCSLCLEIFDDGLILFVETKAYGAAVQQQKMFCSLTWHRFHWALRLPGEL